ncbi:MAG: hypothetical protein EPN93_09020 [Spirochaetes bacterium]|nr:MAG: hypothetical protein EPN93_09020 [Spirochaetota bacterium]
MRIVRIAVAALVMSGIALTADGAPRGRDDRQDAARKMIRRTGAVILLAQKKVRENRVFTGDLAKAAAHQKLARRLFREGHYLRAMFHTKRARALAVLAIRANRGADPSDADISADEAGAMGNAPADADLDLKLAADMPGEPVRDEDIVDTSLDAGEN